MNRKIKTLAFKIIIHYLFFLHGSQHMWSYMPPSWTWVTEDATVQQTPVKISVCVWERQVFLHVQNCARSIISSSSSSPLSGLLFRHALCTVPLHIFYVSPCLSGSKWMANWLRQEPARRRSGRGSRQRARNRRLCVWTTLIVQNEADFVATCRRLCRSPSERALTVRWAVFSHTLSALLYWSLHTQSWSLWSPIPTYSISTVPTVVPVPTGKDRSKM